MCSLYQMIRSLSRNDQGIVTVLFALLLPVMMAMFALVIDGGNLYIRHAELQFLAQQSSSSGLLAFSKVIETRAEQNKLAACTVIFPALPPPICSSSNSFNFVSDNEILSLYADMTIQNKIKNISQDFAQDYDPQLKITNTNIQSSFGDGFHLGDDVILLKITLEETPDRFLTNFLPGNPMIKIESVSKLPLN